MGSRDKEMAQMRPIPPSNLTTETLAVWSAWSKMGDKEVTREAANKGVYIKLAIQFLSARRRCEPEAALIRFKDEVLVWVCELLKHRQVHKVTHILTNIDLDPIEELIKIFSDSTNQELREFLGNHLLSQGRLQPKLFHNWALLKCIEKDKIVFKNVQEEVKPFNVSSLLKKPEGWKYKIGCDLYLRSFEFALEPFLQPKILWRALLEMHNTELLIMWINTQFSNHKFEAKNLNFEPIIVDQLRQIFEAFIITSEIIEMVEKIHDGNDLRIKTNETVLNEFSKFGIFVPEDCNFPSILNRLRDTRQLENIENILSSTCCSVRFEDFNIFLLEYCLGNELYSIINYFMCTEKYISIHISNHFKSKYLDLIRDIKATSENINNSVILSKNISKVGQFLSSDNLSKYYIDNPIILLAALIFSNKADAILHKQKITLNNFEVSAEVITSLLQQLPYVDSVLTRITTNNKEVAFTYLDCLNKQDYIDVQGIFPFQFNNRKTMPHFASADLVSKYAYSKEIDYIFYIKQGRPTAACEFYLINKLKGTKSMSLSNLEKDTILDKVFRVAIKNFVKQNITSSCAAFLEIIGLSSDKLRLHIQVALQIFNANHYSEIEVKTLMQNVFLCPEDVYQALERSVTENTKLNKYSSEVEAIEAIRTVDILVKFATVHNLKLPESFLKFCGGNNWWIMFLIIVQIHNYTDEQSRKLLESFEDHNVAEHLSHAILANIPVDDELMKDRDPRNSYLARLGLRRTDETEMSSSSSSQSSGTFLPYSDDFNVDDFIPNKTNLLLVLIKAHNSADPPKALLRTSLSYKNPVLALLATCYEPGSYLTYWLTWLVVSCDLSDEYRNIESLIISAKSVKEILGACLQKKCYRSLLQSFQIFLPEHPLGLFIEFLIEPITFKFNKENALQQLETFESQLKNLMSNNLIITEDVEMTYLNNRIWIEMVANVLIGKTLEYNLSSRHSQIKFLSLLCEVKINKFVNNSPDYKSILKLLQSLADESKICHSINLSYIYNEVEYKREVIECSQNLLKLNLFDKALLVAKHGNILTDFILIKEWEYKFSHYFKLTPNFWRSCNTAFKNNGMTCESAVRFYLDQLEKLLTAEHKYEILQLAQEWARKNYLPETYKIEKQLWELFFELQIANPEINRPIDETESFIYSKMQEELDLLFKEKDNYVDDSIESVSSRELLNMTTDLLREGDIWQALKLERLFVFDHQDLKIIKICFQLAEGQIYPNLLTCEQRFLLTESRHSRTSSNRVSFVEDIPSIIEPGPSNSVYLHEVEENDIAPEVLSTIDQYCDRLKIGEEIGYKILRSFRICVNSQLEYKDVIETSEPFQLLKTALNKDCKKKLDVVIDFIAIFKWNKEQVSDFVCLQVIEATGECAKQHSESVVLWDLELDRYFNMIYQVIPENCTLLGYKLYTYASTLLKIQTESNVKYEIKNFIPIIEILIRSHDCFTNDCNMEGITLVLKKCHPIISILLNLQDWKHIVRLLTGIGRYTEMNYVFHLLQANEQFEFLLRKGSNKDTALKIALLDYLRNNCPENDEMYRMVALHFVLYSEVALLWEREAANIINNLVAIAKLEMQTNNVNSDVSVYVNLTATDETKLLVQKAMLYYTHAAEYHIHGDKLSKAMNAAKQAELLALQRYLLKNKDSGICILQLSNAQIQSLITTMLSFQQALIVVEAYQYKVDWAVVIYEQYIARSKEDFLEDFLKSLPLTDNLLNDISRRYMMSNLKTDASNNNMRKLLKKLVSVHAKYRISSELGFTDIGEELLSGNQLAYLRDTVWKQGYNEI